MPAIIHSGRCDQAKECSCPAVCPFGAWLRKDEKWLIDESKCTGCGLCIKECPAEAVLLAKTAEEKEIILKQIENDTERTALTLFVERYGGVPIEQQIKISAEEVGSKVASGLAVVEVFKEESIMCLVKCAPYYKFISNIQIYKLDADEHPELADQYAITKFPSLLIFQNGKEIGRIEGFVEDIEYLRRRLAEITK